MMSLADVSHSETLHGSPCETLRASGRGSKATPSVICFEPHIPSPTEFAIRQILTQYQTITEIAFAVSFFVVYNACRGVV